MNITNETLNSTFPIVFKNDDNPLNNYTNIGLSCFMLIINIFFIISQKSNVKKIFDKIFELNWDKLTLLKMNAFINDYIRNDKIILKKNEIINKRRNWLKDTSDLKNVNFKDDSEIKKIDLEL